MYRIKSLLLAVMLLCLPSLAAAERAPGKYMVMSGTGFLVSRSGHIITNHHVVEGCEEVDLQGAISDATAKVVAVDEEYDLALLKTTARVPNIATIRHPGATRLKIDEPMLVMGYPMGSQLKGEYKVAKSRILGLKGPTEEPHWIQFSDSVQRGNSGGPLLDSSGNVAGVIVAKSELYKSVGINGKPELVQKSDLAISLPILMRFLDRHYVAYSFNGSYSFVSEGRVENEAKDYIVNVLCFHPQ